VKKFTKQLAKAAVESQPAIAEINAMLGYDIRSVLSDEMWAVCEIDGKPMVTVDMEGMRVIARFTPRPGAVEVTEELIATVEREVGGER